MHHADYLWPLKMLVLLVERTLRPPYKPAKRLVTKTNKRLYTKPLNQLNSKFSVKIDILRRGDSIPDKTETLTNSVRYLVLLLLLKISPIYSKDEILTPEELQKIGNNQRKDGIRGGVLYILTVGRLKV